MKDKTCCFTGHRRLPIDRIENVKKRLNDEVENLFRIGVTEYISGGALGFDQLAASLIISKKELGYNMRLILALPCKNQDERWTIAQKRTYQYILHRADEIIYVSDRYTPDCMKKRNFYMVDHSSYCICALLNDKSGTGQTVRYAKRQGITVLNVLE